MNAENKITKVVIELLADDYYHVLLTKRFAPQYGGDEAVLNLGAYRHLDFALAAAKVVVTKDVNGRWY